MFIKPFKIKSNVQLKGSENKKLRNKVLDEFPHISQEELLNLIPNKATVTLVKVTTHVNWICNIYAIDKRPIFFEDETNALVPTVYAMWLVSTLIPYLTTHPDVLPRLANGADLMLPGVIRKAGGLDSFGNLKKDQLAAVNLTSNSASVGVGRLARSSYDLYMSAGSGPCLKMLHVFGDKLWCLEPSVTLQIPNMSPVLSSPCLEDFPELGAKQKNKTAISVDPSLVAKENTDEKIGANEVILDETADLSNLDTCENKDEGMKTEITEQSSMDHILKTAFLTVLKLDGNKLTLPLLTSNFYRLHVLPAAKTPIDLKKTSYKKLSKFLCIMSEKGFIVVREETKGVEKIISIDFDHPELIEFIPDSDSADNNQEKDSPLFHVAMTELYTVTSETLSFFSKLGFRKGDGIESVNIKKLLKDYISKKKIAYVNDTKILSLDPVLANVCEKPESTFNELLSIMLSKMFHTYEMKAKNEIKGSKKPNIQMTLATRSGNKKVTLVNNLEAYGIILAEFAKTCKLGAAASTSIIKSENQKHDILQIQGNQVKLIYDILTETYKIPPRQITGIDLARKEKKKKK